MTDLITLINSLSKENIAHKMGNQTIRYMINLTGHPINVESSGGVLTIPTAKDQSGNTWALKVVSAPSDLSQVIYQSGEPLIHLYSPSTSIGELFLFCKETKEEIAVPFDTCYRYPSALNGMTPIVSAMTGSCLASKTALLPMTAPHENPTRNEKGWIVSVKGLRFNKG